MQSIVSISCQNCGGHQCYTKCCQKSMRGRWFGVVDSFWNAFVKPALQCHIRYWSASRYTIEEKHCSTPTVDQRIPPYSHSIMWPLCYICETLQRCTPPYMFYYSWMCDWGAASFTESEIVASERERDHRIWSGLDKNETSPLCPSGDPLPGNLCVIREFKTSGTHALQSDVNNLQQISTPVTDGNSNPSAVSIPQMKTE